MKKLKPILGISLLVQSVTFFILCLVNVEKRKNLARTFGVFGAIGGVAGAALLISEYKTRKKLREAEDEEFYDEFDEFYDELSDELDVADEEILCTFEDSGAE